MCLKNICNYDKIAMASNPIRPSQSLLIIALVFARLAESLDDCFTSRDTYECRLGPITPYRLIANRNDSELQYPGCVPKKIWLFVRHGTRYPGKQWTANMLEESRYLRDSVVGGRKSGEGTLSDREVDQFEKWKFRFTKDTIMNLAEEGERELVGIAERFQSRFPSIMPEIYSNRIYKFKYTATQRAEESAKNFALGLFGRGQSLNVRYPPSEYRDPILRFYKCCKRWRTEVDKNPRSYREYEKFIESPIVHDAVVDVSKRAGFELDYGKVRLIYTLCAFETACYENDKSPWCGLLSLENFKVLEFAQDLKYYWIDGYGYSLTYEQACSAMTDLFDYFESDDDVTTTAYFTHSGALLKMLAFLGVARDEKALRHDSFAEEKDRAWRTSMIDSFASNIAFILYDCGTQGPGIVLMHQERVVHLDGCPVDAPCPLSIMKEKYPANEAECRFNDLCAI